MLIKLLSYIPITCFLGVILLTIWSTSNGLCLDLSYYYTGHTSTSDNINRVDFRLGYRPTKSVELSLIATNLFDSKHTESNPEATRANTNIERAVIGKSSYKFD